MSRKVQLLVGAQDGTKTKEDKIDFEAQFIFSNENKNACFNHNNAVCLLPAQWSDTRRIDERTYIKRNAR